MPVNIASSINLNMWRAPGFESSVSGRAAERMALQPVQHVNDGSGLRPIRLGERGSHSTGSIGREDQHERALLPLVQVDNGRDVLASAIEFHVALHALEGVAGMQLLDEHGIVEAVILRDSLRHD